MFFFFFCHRLGCLVPWRIEIEIHAPQLGLVTHIVEALIEIVAVCLWPVTLGPVIVAGIVAGIEIAGAG